MAFNWGSAGGGAAAGFGTGAMLGGPAGAGIGFLAGGLLGGLGGGDKKGANINIEDLLPSWQRDSLKNLSAWANQYLKNFVPGEAYGGKLTTESTSQEKTGLGILDKYLAAPATGDLFASAKDEIMKTLGGTYKDVGESPWIKALTQLSGRNLETAISESRRGAGARGSFFSTGAMSDEEKLREGSTMNLDEIIGRFIESERGRQFQAVPRALQLEEYGKATAPLKQIGASQVYGGLERTIDMANYENLYQDYLRQRKEMVLPLQTAQGLAGGTPFISKYTEPTQVQTSPIENILKMITQLNLGKSSFSNMFSTPSVTVSPAGAGGAIV